jgi:hypothetical protein
MAAAKYHVQEQLRKDHFLELVQKPLENVRNTIAQPEALIRVSLSHTTLSNNQYSVRFEEPFPVDYELIFAHLKTGYPQLFQQYASARNYV